MTYLTAQLESIRPNNTALTAKLKSWFVAYVDARSRRSQIERLNALSDDQLAQMGILRRDIPRHVFRDLI